MNCRVMKREEFVARMLADQELLRDKHKKARYKAAEDLSAMRQAKQARYLREKKRGRYM